SELPNNEFYSVYDFDDGLLGSHGKGASKYQSMASAIMEYAERKSWYEYNMGKAKGFIKASYNELKDKIDMSSYDDVFKIHYFKEILENEIILKDTPFYWVEAYNMTRNKPELYPVNYIDIMKSSNGLAAGNTKEEAITQGLCELIEREHIDSFLLDPYNARVRLIDHSSIINPYLLKLLEWAKIKKMQVYFLDISNDLPVTTIIVHCIDNNAPTVYTRTGNGYGTHNDPEKAMIRALTEFHQGRESYLKDVPKNFTMTKGQWQTHLILDFTRIINNAKTISAKDCFNINHDDFKKDAEKILSILKDKGHEVIALNLTHKDLKVPVYRLLIPKFKTGDEFSPFGRNQYYKICFLLKNGKVDDRAWEYYQKHKHQISEIDEESRELIKQVNRSIGSSINLEAQQRKMLQDDIIYKYMMPRNHIDLFKFSSYYKRDFFEAMKALWGINLVDSDDKTISSETDLNSAQEQQVPA
ncbi:MAG: YcaO-like family protein, partial [Candidatus Riflemargulisbacteria bacterium]